MSSLQDSSHPYADLTPDCVIDALCSTGLLPDGRLVEPAQAVRA